MNMIYIVVCKYGLFVVIIAIHVRRIKWQFNDKHFPPSVSQLQVTPSAPPRPSSPNPGYSAPCPLPSSPANPSYTQTTPTGYSPTYPPSPANPGYTQTTPTGYTPTYPPSPANPGYPQTTPPAPYTTPPHPAQYTHHPGYSPSPHGQPYPGGYYTSPSGGYVPPMQYPPGQYYPPPTSGYPGYPPQPPPNALGVSPGISQEFPPQYRQLFPPGESVDGGEAEPTPSELERCDIYQFLTLQYFSFAFAL